MPTWFHRLTGILGTASLALSQVAQVIPAVRVVATIVGGVLLVATDLEKALTKGTPAP